MSNIAKFYQTKTHDYESFFKNYESSPKEKELNSLIKGLNEQFEKAQETHESVEKVTIPKIEAIGHTKWSAIVEQLLELCKVAEEIGIRSQLSNFMRISFNRDDTGELYTLRLGWYSPLKHYILTYGYTDCIFSDTTLCPVKEYCPKSELEDKDGWLAKWDEYDIYNMFRSKLIKEIQRRIEVENAKTNEILDRYAEFAGE